MAGIRIAGKRPTAPRRYMLAMVIAVFLTAAAGAEADERYAATSDQGNGSCDSVANACDLQTAAEGAAGGDEVIVLAGTYNEGADFLDVPSDVDIHGQSAAAKPTITFANPPQPGITVDGAGGRIAALRLSLTSAALGSPLYVDGGARAEQVEVTALGDVVSACRIESGILRDSFCTAAGNTVYAVYVAGLGGPGSATLRNVTAVATGGPSYGLTALASSGMTGEVEVDAANVIASGATDVWAITSGADSTIDLAYSNYDTIDPDPGTSITAVGSPTNQTAAALLGADGFTQLSGSPTLGAGTVDADTSAVDIIGEARPQGTGPDIGADESAAAATPPPSGQPNPPPPPSSGKKKKCKKKKGKSAQAAAKKCKKQKKKK